MLNRSAVIVRPAQPFMDWAAGLDESEVLPDPAGEQTVYLVPELEDDDQGMRVLRRMWPVIFEAELEGWHTVEADWPQNRTFGMFRKWFTVEWHSVIEDLGDRPLVDDEV